MVPTPPTKADLARGARIRAARKAAGFTVKQLAKLVGVHVNHMYCLEQGKYRPKSETLAELATNLKVSMDYLDHGAKS